MTVVVGYLPNELGQAALDAAIAEARLRRQPLVVVNTSKGDALVDPRFASDDALAGVDTRLSGLDIQHEIRQTVGADVAEQILDVVSDVDASLLVIGLRHRSAVGKLLMGSVAQRLLMDCPCPVLGVKQPR
jgi:nucleotide-binding universal stress UspA family protein